ncbi:hypothetical protein CMV_025476 [Castanea mollissima]|uniref:Uncharacterized protein n=1 Tax=Castanea mollissima TaxID=60419 RepID=A0A8J4QLW6_9ROSI|nr:hypothetical protein CMV_025476 [Castanea mollissima]
MLSLRVAALFYAGSNCHESTKHKAASMHLPRPGTCWKQNRDGVFILSYKTTVIVEDFCEQSLTCTAVIYKADGNSTFLPR